MENLEKTNIIMSYCQMYQAWKNHFWYKYMNHKIHNISSQMSISKDAFIMLSKTSSFYFALWEVRLLSPELQPFLGYLTLQKTFLSICLRKTKLGLTVRFKTRLSNTCSRRTHILGMSKCAFTIQYLLVIDITMERLILIDWLLNDVAVLFYYVLYITY